MNNDEIKLDERVLDYIKKELRKGFSEEEITNVLTRAGYDLKIIEEHIKHASKSIIIKNFTVATILILLTTLAAFYFYNTMYGKFFKTSASNLVSYKNDVGFTPSEFLTSGSAVSNETINEMFRLAKRHYISKKYDKAIREFQELSILRPNRAVFHFYLGGIYCQSGNYKLAIEEYEKAISLNQKNPFNYLAMARCYVRQGEDEKAFKILNTSLYVNINSSIYEDIDYI